MKAKENAGSKVPKVAATKARRTVAAKGKTKKATTLVVLGTRPVGRVHETTLTTGIERNPEFEKKGLAQYAVNIGTRCGHQCLYCSSNAQLRLHRSFKKAGERPFEFGYAIVDPKMPDRVARDADRLWPRGLIELCTTVDAWAPEAQERNLGRRCLEAILWHAGWEVRILTKNAAVTKDFDLVAKYRDRVAVGLSLTGTARQEEILKVLETNASPITHRMAAMQKAHKLGLRTFGMLCPLLPGIADDPKTVDELVQFCLDNGAEEIFAEAVNPRGNSLRLCAEALQEAGFEKEAAAVNAVRDEKNWSAYVVRLVKKVQNAMKKYGVLDKLRFLLYTAGLQNSDLKSIRNDDAGVRWLGKSE